MIGTPKQNIDRLLGLAQFLREEVKRPDFNQADWFQSKYHEGLPLNSLIDKKRKPIHCKTACCVAGWATHYHPNLFVSVTGDVRLERPNEETFPAALGAHAMAEAFGINFSRAVDLCNGDAPHQTPKKAAKAVEREAEVLAEQFGYDIVDA